ncbi:thermonuclease family protein [uncultured Cetobacterium sp.]|uniref:thermonuclease family protein n=1 Tax=uncultured Cetobacterium sp. TaxID=527638 RepID=UPI0026202400|nr:thermonuclease family protein [uncultured Cetobacterium sp.]
MRKILILVLGLLLTFCALGKNISGKVIKVADGDTITILDKGKKVRVRFYGIDAPEKKQEYGLKSFNILKKLVNKKEVTVHIKDKDQYGRVVGIVYLSDKNINLYMLKSGNAWWYKRYAKNEYKFRLAVKEAQKKDLGLWKEKNPTPPWIFRKNNRKG